MKLGTFVYPFFVVTFLDHLTQSDNKHGFKMCSKKQVTIFYTFRKTLRMSVLGFCYRFYNTHTLGWHRRIFTVRTTAQSLFFILQSRTPVSFALSLSMRTRTLTPVSAERPAFARRCGGRQLPDVDRLDGAARHGGAQPAAVAAAAALHVPDGRGDAARAHHFGRARAPPHRRRHVWRQRDGQRKGRPRDGPVPPRARRRRARRRGLSSRFQTLACRRAAGRASGCRERPA